MDGLVTEILALIPARGGSKSIPRKNIRPFAGHPLIAYSIAAALASELVTRVVVSTDDEEIAAIAREYGAEVPFLRPFELAQDDTPDLPVFQHALYWLAEEEGYHPDIVVHLRPTSPLRQTGHIDQAVLQLLEHPEADSIRSVIVPFQNPFKMWTISEAGYLEPLLKVEFNEPYNLPRQSLPVVYWQTGYVDAAWRETIMKKNSMTGELILPMIMGTEDWIDIDSPDDWLRAERLLLNGEISSEELGYEVRKIDKN